MDYIEMRAMEKTHCCAQCQAPLVTIWGELSQDYMLVCSMDHHHQGYQQIPSASELLARGKADEIMGKGAQKDLERLALRGAKPLSKLPTTDIATGKELSKEQLNGLITWGMDLGLKPWLGHVCLYYGKPYVTIDGYYYLLATRQPGVKIGTRAANTLEREEVRVGKEDHLWVAEAWEGGHQLATKGWGAVTKEELEEKSPRDPGQFRAPVVHSHPMRMAEKRAEWQLLRKLVPLGE